MANLIEFGCFPSLTAPTEAMADWTSWNFQLRANCSITKALEAAGIDQSELAEINRWKSERTGWRFLTFSLSNASVFKALCEAFPASEFEALSANLELLKAAVLTSKGTLRKAPKALDQCFYPQSVLPSRELVKRSAKPSVLKAQSPSGGWAFLRCRFRTDPRWKFLLEPS